MTVPDNYKDFANRPTNQQAADFLQKLYLNPTGQTIDQAYNKLKTNSTDKYIGGTMTMK